MNLLPLILFLILAPGQLVNDGNQVDRYLQKGLDLERQGKPEQALKLWDRAKGKLEIPSLAIATEYLRMATEHELSNYYRPAFFYYLWALSGTGKAAMHANKTALHEELARLKPLINQQQFKRWRVLYENGNPTLFRELYHFWKRHDLTPVSLYNERLIEHWQRIAHAREQFTQTGDPPYGTDDRGTVYIKYGEPGRIDSGRVRITQAEIRRALSRIIPRNYCDQGPNNYYQMLISNRINGMFINPEYELWIYNTPGEKMRHNLVLIFSKEPDGTYNRLQILEDFMPQSAFSLTISRDCETHGLPPIPPGMVLQLIFYEHFSKIDPFFAQLYSGLQLELLGGRANTLPDAYLGSFLKQKNSNQMRQIWRQAPDEISTEKKRIANIPLEVYQYRLLNEDNQPAFATFVESRPLETIFYDHMINRDTASTSQNNTFELNAEEISDSYQLTHGVQIRNEYGKLLDQNRRTPTLMYHPSGDVYTSSAYVIGQLPVRGEQMFYTKVNNLNPTLNTHGQSLLPNSLIGLGQQEVSQPEPLSIRPVEVELLMGDLILGYGKKQTPDEHTQSLFNFVVSNQRKIPEGKNLVVHFEVYQLRTDKNGTARFEVEIKIRPRGGLLGWTQKKQDQFNMTLNFETFDNRFAESLEIDPAAELEAGKCELSWIIYDTQSGQKLERKLRFEVVEQNDI